jgi:hypothetical protein
LAGAFFYLCSVACVFTQPHYYAPITGLIYAVVVQSMRHLRVWRPGGRRPASYWSGPSRFWPSAWAQSRWGRPLWRPESSFREPGSCRRSNRCLGAIS